MHYRVRITCVSVCFWVGNRFYYLISKLCRVGLGSNNTAEAVKEIYPWGTAF